MDRTPAVHVARPADRGGRTPTSRRRPLGALTTAWRSREERIARDRARAAALRAFATRHPAWAASWWDAAFVRRADATAAIDAGDARALARAWTGQFAYRDERRRSLDTERLTPVATEFLRLVDVNAARRSARPGGGGSWKT